MKNDEFWNAIDKLVAESEIIIDRPKGTVHPKYPDFVYHVDYGYLKNTTSMDNAGIDVWIGSDSSQAIDAIICTVDLLKRDSEIKILIGCTESEKELVFQTHNESQYYERNFDTQTKSMVGGGIMIREISEKDYNSLMT